MEQTSTGVEHEKASIMKAYFKIAKPEDYLGQSKDHDYLRRVFSLPNFAPSASQPDIFSRTTGMYHASGSVALVSYAPLEISSGRYQPMARNGSGYKNHNSEMIYQ